MESQFNQFHATHSFTARRLHESGVSEDELDEMLDTVCAKLEATLRGVCEYRMENGHDRMNTDVTITFLAPDDADDEYIERTFAHARHEMEERIDEQRVKMEAEG